MVFDRLERSILPWHVLVAWAVAIAALLFMVLVTIPHIDELTEGLQVLSLQLGGFEHEEVEALVVALGHEGVEYYAATQSIAEIAFAVAAFLALSMTMILLTRDNARFSLPLPEAIRLVVVAAAFCAFVCHVVSVFATWAAFASEPPPAGAVELANTTISVMLIAYIAAIAGTAVIVIFAALRGTGGQPVRA